MSLTMGRIRMALATILSLAMATVLFLSPAEAASYVKITSNGSGGYNYQYGTGYPAGGATGGSNYVTFKSPYRPVPQIPAPAPAPTPAPATPPGTGSSGGGTVNPAPAAGLSAGEQYLAGAINRERAAVGAPPLQVDMQLVSLARSKSSDMIANNYFGHTSPTYGTPGQMLAAAGVKYRAMGENIAGNRTVEGAHTSLMNSSGHRQNILNPSFTHLGVGVVAGGPYGLMITEIFITR